MHTILRIALVFAVLTGVAGAEEFYLKWEKTGKIYGPFDTAAGSKVSIGSAQFTLVQKGKSAAEERLAAITLPQLDMRQANFYDAIDFLRRQVETCGKKNETVNFVVLKPPAPKAEKPSADPFGDGFGMPAGSRTPTITLQLRDVSALQALKIIIEQAGAAYKTSGNTVTIALKK